ncbi:peptidase [Noumeavirus]|uniref:Peptidase n=1 Tax=Marseillevirus sp. TaxID=2809551 RepID=A0AA96ELW2_9VIRU|nr:peptidase [Noumeavirus]AQM72988.1 peptidase [Noumeavirus]WNL50077.1 peptidase [Marseillevirus sp.]
MNNILKKEFETTKGLFIPVYRNISSAPIPSIGGVAYNNSTQLLLLSDGLTWYSPTTPSASPTVRGLVFGTTSTADPSATGLGNNCGTAVGENVFVGIQSGFLNIGVQTGLTFVGYLSGRALQSVNNKTLIGRSAGVQIGLQQNAVGIGSGVLANATGSDGIAIGTFSQNANLGSRSCGIGSSTLGTSLSPVYDDCVAIGYNRLVSPETCTGVINVGSSTTEWPSGTSTDVVYIGNSSDLSSNINNVVALGSGTFAGAPVTDNTLVIDDTITQWRSFGMTFAASVNILQFDPVTGLITQAASSRRFKENIQDADDKVPSLANSKVCTYDIDGGTGHGFIAEDIPEFYASFDRDGINGVLLTRIIMALLCEVQKLKKEILEKKSQR